MLRGDVFGVADGHSAVPSPDAASTNVARGTIDSNLNPNCGDAEPCDEGAADSEVTGRPSRCSCPGTRKQRSDANASRNSPFELGTRRQSG